MCKDGEETGRFGLWLTQELEDFSQYQVYYDHGDPQKYDNVKAIKAFLGEQVTRGNKLADVDVLVANQENEILFLIEIEESPISPKTLLGDVFASLLSTGFAVRNGRDQVSFTITEKTKLIVAGYLPIVKGESSTFVSSLRSRLNEFSAPASSISLEQVDLLVTSNFDVCISTLKSMVLDDLF